MSVSPIERLPYELHIFILSHLNKSDLVPCYGTCKKWKQISDDQELWQKIDAKIFIVWNLQADRTDFLRLSHQHTEVNDQMVPRIQAFLNKVAVGQKAKFTCFAGRGANYQTFSIEILPTPLIIGAVEWEVYNSGFDLEEHCFSYNSIPVENDVLFFLRHKIKNDYFYNSNVFGKDVIGFYCVKSHSACFRIPSGLYDSPLQKRIHRLINVKLLQLANMSRKNKNCCAIL